MPVFFCAQGRLFFVLLLPTTYTLVLPATLLARGARSAMAIAAADRAVITRLKRELGDLFAAVCAFPVALDHGAVTPVTRGTCRSARTIAVATLEGVELIIARRKRQLGDLRAALCARPITLHHRARSITTTVIITVHMFYLRSYVLLTHDPLERNYLLGG